MLEYMCGEEMFTGRHPQNVSPRHSVAVKLHLKKSHPFGCDFSIYRNSVQTIPTLKKILQRKKQKYL